MIFAEFVVFATLRNIERFCDSADFVAHFKSCLFCIGRQVKKSFIFPLTRNQVLKEFSVLRKYNAVAVLSTFPLDMHRRKGVNSSVLNSSYKGVFRKVYVRLHTQDG